MGAKPTDHETKKSLVDAIDALYAAPFDDFVALRGELTASLRTAGDKSTAKAVAAAKKPTRTAWALNQVARAEPRLVGEVVACRAAAIAAQTNGDADEIRDGVRRYREAVAEVIRAVREVLGKDRIALSAVHARRLAETLQVIATDDVARAELVAGRLTQDVAVDDPFGEIDASSLSGPAKVRPAAPAEAPSKRIEEEAARAREVERLRREKQHATEEARARVTTSEQALAVARKAASDADRALRLAQNHADQSRTAVDEATETLARARQHLKDVVK